MSASPPIIDTLMSASATPNGESTWGAWVLSKWQQVDVDWDAPPTYSSLGWGQLFLFTIGTTIVLSSAWNTGSRLGRKDAKTPKGELATAMMCIAGLRYLTAICAHILWGLKAWRPDHDLTIWSEGFDCFADACNSYALVAMQAVCSSLLRNSIDAERPYEALQSRKEKLVRVLAGVSQLFLVVAPVFVLLGFDGDESDGTLRLGVGRRMTTAVQAVTQALLLVALFLTKRDSSLYLPADVPEHTRKIRGVYIDQAFGSLVILTAAIVSLVSRAFHVKGEVSDSLSSPMFIFWAEFVVLLAFNSTLLRQLDIEEQASKDEALIRLDEEEKQLGERDEDEHKVELLVQVE